MVGVPVTAMPWCRGAPVAPRRAAVRCVAWAAEHDGRVLEDADLLEVIRREKLLLDPALRASAEDVTALLHPDFVEFGASGRVWDRASIVSALAEDPTVSGESTDFRTAPLADNVVLLTYRVTGEPGSLRSSVWVRDANAGWRLRFHQGTRSTR